MKGFRSLRFLGCLAWAAGMSAGVSTAQVQSSPLEIAADAGTQADRASSDFASPENSSPPAKAATTLTSDPGYVLQPDDVIEAVVFRETDLTTDGMVRKDGRFDMKLIGAVKVVGLTLDQASEVIRAALAKDYLVNPRVNLGMLAYAKRKVDILGEVRSPGVYTFPPRGPLTLGDAVALAGGFLPTADASHVAVKRQEQERLVTLTVDASATAGTFSLAPEDSISIPILPRRHFTVLGQIARPGTYEMPEGRPVYLTDAIAVAGGYTRIANPSRVLLKRIAGGHETVMALNAKAMANSPDTPPMEVQNEDTITVTESMF